ncbi:hypothetical protein B296_00008952 [Ensete ventricosum]|uniref:Uncharacterized protein n=1 Tax=Ensete ventricosum TaxID=4639 RepID=A0A427AH35_ENSVE|nr:hypothetical protein B296_00008952 [Ensete ventricosum]
MDGLGHTLARKWSLNSLASWSKYEIEDGLSRLSHTQAGPRRIVGNVRYIRVSYVLYRAIWAQKMVMCSAVPEPSS